MWKYKKIHENYNSYKIKVILQEEKEKKIVKGNILLKSNPSNISIEIIPELFK